jgi:hypothetical protein
MRDLQSMHSHLLSYTLLDSPTRFVIMLCRIGDLTSPHRQSLPVALSHLLLHIFSI